MNFIRNSSHKCRVQLCNEVNLDRIFVKGYSTKKVKEKNLATVKALKHFDDFYGGIFKYKWHSIRLGLLSHPKHVALINNFGDVQETKELLKNDGALDLKLLLKNKDQEEGSIEQYADEGFAKSTDDHDIIGDVIDKKEEEEKDILKALYPEGSGKNFDKLFNDYKIEEEDEEISEGPASLHEALSHSQIDTSRLIDPSMGLDTSSLHEYVPVTELRGKEGYIPEGDYYRFYKVKSEIDIHAEPQDELPFPEHLNVYCYPRGDISRFPSPKKCVNNVFNYYPMDGASILPVLALGLEPGDRVLDLCAAPGGKSLTMLQTMIPSLLVCNDSSLSRSNRINNVFHQYLDNYPNSWRESVMLRVVRGEAYVNDNNFNKILVDAPCTTDRVSAVEEDNNIFKSMRTKERLRLPESQANILANALAIVKPGGTVVYSTCTLSPIQNDGVVNLALQNVWKNHGVECTVVDLKPALAKMKHFYQFATNVGLRYGSLVVPFVPVNFGPMYFCKLVKKR